MSNTSSAIAAMFESRAKVLSAEAETARLDAARKSQAVVAALQSSLEFTRYAAAPFFGGQWLWRDEGGDAIQVQRTTQEWWEGLREQIEALQPALEACIAACKTEEAK